MAPLNRYRYSLLLFKRFWNSTWRGSTCILSRFRTCSSVFICSSLSRCTLRWLYSNKRYKQWGVEVHLLQSIDGFEAIAIDVAVIREVVHGWMFHLHVHQRRQGLPPVGLVLFLVRILPREHVACVIKCWIGLPIWIRYCFERLGHRESLARGTQLNSGDLFYFFE